jgi:hypothetical protein
MRSVIKWLVEMGRKIMRALGFGGKDDEKDKKKDKKGDGEVGEHVSFTGAGESHTLYFDEHGDNATLMMASTPMTVKQRIDDFRKRLTGEGGKLPFFSDDRERDQAIELLAKAEAQSKGADLDADRLVRDHRAAAKEAASGSTSVSSEAADAKLTQEEQSLAATMAQLYDLFEEHPGYDELEMRSSYGGAVGSGEVSYQISKRRSKSGTGFANVMISGPVAGYAPPTQRGRAKAEAVALQAALKQQMVVPPPTGIESQLDALTEAATSGETFATKHLAGEKVQPAPGQLEEDLNEVAKKAGPVADVKLVGGGEIIERAVSRLSDERRHQPGGIFNIINSITVEVRRLTLESKATDKRNKQLQAAAVAAGLPPESVTREKASKTMRGLPTGGFGESADTRLPAVVIGARGPVVSAIASYEELVNAVRLTADGFGPNLAAAFLGVRIPLGSALQVPAYVTMTLRGVEVEKDQDRFLQELSLLMQIEMVRAKAAWAFAVTHLASATTAAAAAQALGQDFFPPAQKKFVKEYEKWGPEVFDQASDALFKKLGIEFEKQSGGLKSGGRVFLKVDEIDKAVETVKAALDKLFQQLAAKP